MSPFVCAKPFQLPKSLLPLFKIGINVMRNVACGTAIYRVYPFCLLQVGEIGAFEIIVHGAIGASETNL